MRSPDYPNPDSRNDHVYRTRIREDVAARAVHSDPPRLFEQAQKGKTFSRRAASAIADGSEREPIVSRHARSSSKAVAGSVGFRTPASRGGCRTRPSAESGQHAPGRAGESDSGRRRRAGRAAVTRATPRLFGTHPYNGSREAAGLCDSLPLGAAALRRAAPGRQRRGSPDTAVKCMSSSASSEKPPAVPGATSRWKLGFCQRRS